VVDDEEEDVDTDGVGHLFNMCFGEIGLVGCGDGDGKRNLCGGSSPCNGGKERGESIGDSIGEMLY